MGVEVGLFLLFFSRRVGMGIFVRLLMLFRRKVLKLHAILSRFLVYEGKFISLGLF